MTIDNCQYSFKELSQNRLPSLMKEMRISLSQPLQMKDFAKKGSGKQTLLKLSKKPSDFTGCYVLCDKNSPVYVGISRGVINRLLQHAKGNTHFDASFAYRIASKNYKHQMTRTDAMKDEEFRKYFDEAQKNISCMSVAFIEITNDLELYLFEAYCSMELNTFLWNTFRTH